AASSGGFEEDQALPRGHDPGGDPPTSQRRAGTDHARLDQAPAGGPRIDLPAARRRLPHLLRRSGGPRGDSSGPSQTRDDALLQGGPQMKILTTFEAKNAFPRVLKLSRRDVVIVTNRGKPVAAIEGLAGEDDLEDYLLERSPKFWAMIRRARRGRSVGIAQVRKDLGV